MFLQAYDILKNVAGLANWEYWGEGGLNKDTNKPMIKQKEVFIIWIGFLSFLPVSALLEKTCSICLPEVTVCEYFFATVVAVSVTDKWALPFEYLQDWHAQVLWW